MNNTIEITVISVIENISVLLTNNDDEDNHTYHTQDNHHL